MAGMNDAAPMTIGSLASELEHVANNILNRIGSVGDALGGNNPESKGEAVPTQADLHSTLQRALTVLRASQDEILRCEQLVGVAPPQTAASNQLAGAISGAKYPGNPRY